MKKAIDEPITWQDLVKQRATGGLNGVAEVEPCDELKRNLRLLSQGLGAMLQCGPFVACPFCWAPHPAYPPNQALTVDPLIDFVLHGERLRQKYPEEFEAGLKAR